MKYVFLLGITSIIIACASNEDSIKQTVSITDLMGEFEDVNTWDENIETEVDSPKNSDGKVLSDLMISLASLYDTTSLSIPHKMDRYGYNSVKKIRFSDKLNESNSFVDIYQYNFSDSLKLNNAFYNWLDCFGDKCLEIKIGEDIKQTKNSPSYTVVYDTILVSMKYSTDGKSLNFKSFQDSLLTKFGNKFRYAIQTDVKGNLNWKSK